MDEALVARLNEARRFGRGIAYARQHLYASYDMALYGEQPREAMETWRAMEAATTLGHVEATEFPGTFAHVAGGYAAGYYGYMWAEVIALDMLSAYGTNLMDPSVGARFRAEILARGGEESARVLVQRFLGRAVRHDAFFAEITGRR
jgi:thimet oligopeptidase